MENRKTGKLSREYIEKLLLQNGIRPTSQRLEIAEALLAKPQHLSADQVLRKINRNENVVSKATVYNTLNLLAKRGLVHEVIINSGKVFYDSNTRMHHHIYNIDTGMLMDVDAEETVIENLPKLPEGTEQSGVDVIIRVKNKV